MKKRLAFVVGEGLDSFLSEIIQHVSEKYEVRKYISNGVDNIRAATEWADIVWFEWCDDALLTASTQLKRPQTVICRIHSYEVFTNIPQQVSWGYVDHLIFVAPHIQDIFRGVVKDEVSTSVIFNGIDSSRYRFREHAPSNKLAFVGYINYKKNPEMLIQILSALKRYRPDYELHLAGVYQDPRYLLYFEKMKVQLGLEQNLFYHGWVDDVDAWLDDYDYVLSTSVLESFGMGIAQAMVKGIKPIVHNWVGADLIYPREILFNTIDEAVTQIVSPEYHAGAYRRFIEGHYSLKQQLDGIDHLLDRLDG